MLGKAYKYFMTVAKTGSFRQAAGELFVSQPAISKQIKDLEDKLGMPLFSRSTRSVSLTAEGKLLYDALQECDAVLDHTLHRMRRLSAGQYVSGQLRIGLVTNWDPERFHQPCVGDFAERNPELEMYIVRADQDELVSRLREGSLDIIFILNNHQAREPGISCHSIGEYPYMLIISKKHPLAVHDDIMERLDGVKLYTHHVSKSPIAKNLASRNLHPKLMLVPNVESKIAAVECGLGCTVVESCSKAAYSGRLRAYPLPGKGVELVAACLNEKQSDPLVAAFMDNLERLKHLI